MDRTDVELSESLAVPTNDTGTGSGKPSLTFDFFCRIQDSVEHLGRRPVAQDLVGPQMVVEPEVVFQSATGFVGKVKGLASWRVGVQWMREVFLRVSRDVLSATSSSIRASKPIENPSPRTVPFAFGVRPI